MQFRETDFNFVMRLCEELGVYTYYEHSAGKHTLILADGPAAHNPYPGYATIGFVADNRSGTTDRERIHEWQFEKEVQTGRYVLDEYDFKKPSLEMQQRALQPRGHEQAMHEQFDYPGGYDSNGEGDTYVRLRIEEQQARHERVQAYTNARGLATGYTFSVTGHPRGDQNKQWLVVSTRIELTGHALEAAGTPGATFQASFTALPLSLQFRPERLTPKPVVSGAQTATVVGPEDEEIYTDQYGRVKVLFHWDRHGAPDQNASCWIRVGTPWAGPQFGVQRVPRIREEAIVIFLEGDPDRPIIAGMLNNGQQMPSWALPANKTQSGILTRSTLGADAANFNALRFEDKKGAEQLWLHAEKDQLTEVEHDEDKWVGNDRRKTIDGFETNVIHKSRTETVDIDESVTIHGNRDERVDHEERISIGGNRHEDVEHNEHVEIGDNRTEFVGRDETLNVGGDRTEDIGGSQSESIARTCTQNVGFAKMTNVGLGYSLNVGAAMNTLVGAFKAEQVGLFKSESVGQSKTTTIGEDDTLKIGKNRSVDVGQNADSHVGGNATSKIDGTLNEAVKGAVTLNYENALTLTIGADSTQNVSGTATLTATTIRLQATSSITLNVGASTITINPALVSINSPLVKINC